MRLNIVSLALAATATVGLSAPVLAAPSALDAIAVCARISKKSARLQCYDQVARDAAAGRLPNSTMSSAPTSSSFGESSVAGASNTSPTSSAAPASTPAPEGFGSEQVQRSIPTRKAEDGARSAQLEVRSATGWGYARWQMHMADGSYWRTSEDNPDFRPPKPNEVVRIRKGALGSYLMDVGHQAAIRVERVR